MVRVGQGRTARVQGAGTNALVGLNLLDLVVEIDSRPWVEAGRGPLFGVVGETIAAGRLPIRTERFGRPEIMNVCRPSACEIGLS